MLKQKMALLLAAAMLAGAVSGCSNSQQGGEVSADSGASAQSEGSSQAENQEPVTIKFVGYANSAAGFEARAEEFMSQRSDIKVEVQGIPANSWGELMQAISVNIAGGDVPEKHVGIEPFHKLKAAVDQQAAQAAASSNPNALAASVTVIPRYFSLCFLTTPDMSILSQPRVIAKLSQSS